MRRRRSSPRSLGMRCPACSAHTADHRGDGWRCASCGAAGISVGDALIIVEGKLPARGGDVAKLGKVTPRCRDQRIIRHWDEITRLNWPIGRPQNGSSLRTKHSRAKDNTGRLHVDGRTNKKRRHAALKARALAKSAVAEQAQQARKAAGR